MENNVVDFEKLTNYIYEKLNGELTKGQVEKVLDLEEEYLTELGIIAEE